MGFYVLLFGFFKASLFLKIHVKQCKKKIQKIDIFISASKLLMFNYLN